MGCGCKNKANAAQPVQQFQQVQPAQNTQQTQERSQAVQDAIKRTVQKYYTAPGSNTAQ